MSTSPVRGHSSVGTPDRWSPVTPPLPLRQSPGRESGVLVSPKSWDEVSAFPWIRVRMGVERPHVFRKIQDSSLSRERGVKSACSESSACKDSNRFGGTVEEVGAVGPAEKRGRVTYKSGKSKVDYSQ